MRQVVSWVGSPAQEGQRPARGWANGARKSREAPHRLGSPDEFYWFRGRGRMRHGEGAEPGPVASGAGLAYNGGAMMGAAGAAVVPGRATVAGGVALGVETRRGILAAAGWGTLATLALQAAVAFVVYFWPRKLGAFGSRVSVGAPTDYQVGDVKYFVDGKFYLVRLEEGFMALYQKCVHLGCSVPWRPDEERLVEGQTVRGLFVCPCHGSTYLRTGAVVKGPAPRPLDYMPVSLEDGRLLVATGAVRKREAWSPAQAFRVDAP